MTFLTHPSKSRDIDEERSLLQLPFPRRSCLLREPLIYPSSRRLNSLSRSGGCVRDPHIPLGMEGGVIIDEGYGKLGRRRFRASGSCSIVSYRTEDMISSYEVNLQHTNTSQGKKLIQLHMHKTMYINYQISQAK